MALINREVVSLLGGLIRQVSIIAKGRNKFSQGSVIGYS